MLLTMVNSPWAATAGFVLFAGASGSRSRADRYIDGVISWRHGGEAERQVGELLEQLRASAGR